MIDTNPESSLSGSNSNSMISKTPTSVHTLAGDIPKEGATDAITTKETDKTNNLTIPAGYYIENLKLITTNSRISMSFFHSVQQFTIRIVRLIFNNSV